MASSESISSPVYGRVRWRRFGIVMLPAALIAAVLIALTAKGAVAASFSVSGQQFTVTATKLTGTGFEQYGSAYQQASGKSQPVAVPVVRRGPPRGTPGGRGKPPGARLESGRRGDGSFRQRH